MFYSLTFADIQPHLKAALRWVYQKTFSAKDRIAFYDMLAFLLDNNKSLQQAFIDMRNVVTDFGRKHHPYAVLLTDCLSALYEGQGAFEEVLLEWVPVVMVNKFCRRSKRHFLVHDIFDVALNNQSLNGVDNNCKTECNFQLHRQQIDDS